MARREPLTPLAFYESTQRSHITVKNKLYARIDNGIKYIHNRWGENALKNFNLEWVTRGVIHGEHYISSFLGAYLLMNDPTNMAALDYKSYDYGWTTDFWDRLLRTVGRVDTFTLFWSQANGYLWYYKLLPLVNKKVELISPIKSNTLLI
jgi:hypothetical protein